MPADLVALQALYGASPLHTGNDTHRMHDARWRGSFTTLWDTGGHDTLDASGVRSRVSLDLEPEARSDIGSPVVASALGADGKLVTHEYRNTLAIGTGVWLEDAVGSSHDDFIWGNALDNRIWGGRGADRLWGRDGDDVLHGGSGSDEISGGNGTDTAVFSGRRADWQVTRDSGRILVKQARETDTLESVERLLFDDVGIALDIDGAAGQAARLVGAFHGAQAVQDPHRVGEVLALLDDDMAFETVADHLATAVLGPGYSNRELVQTLYRNVVGSEAPIQELTAYLDLLDAGTVSRTGLMALAAQSEANVHHIGLTGLWSTGIAYMPG